MVAAAEEFAVSATRGRIAGPMAANIIKAAENAIVAARDKKGFADEVEGKVVARVSGLVDVSDELPGGGKDARLFLGESFRTKIERCGQSEGASDIGSAFT